MKKIWRAHYLDGHTSQPRPARVTPLKGGLRVELEGAGSILWPYDEIRQTQGHYEGDPVRLERGREPFESLIIPETDFLIPLRSGAGSRAGRFHDPRGRRRRTQWIWAAGFATLAVSFGFYRWGIPLLADRIAERVPLSWEEGLGKSTLNQMAPPEDRVHNAAMDQALSQIVRRLSAAQSQCPYTFQVTVCDLPIVNAFALPGGNIVVYQGLLEQTKSPEELAGVMAHEMQHVILRHTTRRLIQETSTGLLISALSGDFTGSMAFGVKSAGSLALMQYDREEEAQADQEGMLLILRAGIDPQGMIGFFKTLQAKEKMPEFLAYVSDHPSTRDRIERLRALVKDPGFALPPTQPLLPGSDWAGLIKGLGPAKSFSLKSPRVKGKTPPVISK